MVVKWINSRFYKNKCVQLFGWANSRFYVWREHKRTLYACNGSFIYYVIWSYWIGHGCQTFVSLTVTYDALVCVWIRFIFTLKPHIF